VSESFTVVCRYDEAIDAEAMSEDARASYRETFDIAHLRYLDGEKPTLWHCRRLRTSEMVACDREPDEVSRFVAAFARGLVRVDALRTDGGRTQWTRSTEKPLNEKALDAFDFADVKEIGAAIWGRSQLGKGRPAAWPLPATSQLAVGALVSRRAAQMRRSAAASAPSSGSPVAAPTPDAAPVSETSGPATATG
jgi:hypothetical protein